MLGAMARILLSYKDLSIFFEKDFPSASLINSMRTKLPHSHGGKRRSHEFLKTLLLQLKNVMKSVLERTSLEPISNLLEKITYSDFEDSLISWMNENQEEFVKSYMRRLSLLLTKRVKWLVRKNGTFSPKSWRDNAIIEVLQGEQLTLKTWNVKRKTWRDDFIKKLEESMKKISILNTASVTLKEISSQFTPNFVITNLFYPRYRRPIISGISISDFMTFLQAEGSIHLKQEIMTLLEKPLLDEMQTILVMIQDAPRRWVKKPVFTKNTIGFGLDDGQAYSVSFDENNPDIMVHLSFKSREKIICTLQTPHRFHAMIKKGFRPLRGTVTKKNGKKLVLSIPFSKVKDNEENDSEPSHFIAGGLDLGLKTLGVLSIAPVTVEKDGTHVVGKELKNYFLDQRQLAGPRDAFLDKSSKKAVPFNYKRRLVNLQKVGYHLQGKMDAYKLKFPKNFRNKIKFMKLRREWKRVWNKINNIHEEVSRQIASRVIAACQHHDVKILNVEDLSWSKPGRKQEVGYFLKTWQVHWFHGRIQEILLSRAQQEGIMVRKVNPRNTSKRCSRCNKIGTRSRKLFHCQHCGLHLDSDLNAARNIVKMLPSRNMVKTIPFVQITNGQASVNAK